MSSPQEHGKGNEKGRMDREGRGGEGRGTVLQQEPNGTPAVKALSRGRASRAERLSVHISDDWDSSDKNTGSK